MEIDTQEDIKKILQIEGKIRGVFFQTDAVFILEKEGKEGMAKIKERLAKIEPSIPFGDEAVATDWYPIGWRVLELLAIKDAFNWTEENFVEMGKAGPKHSFIMKVLFKYFISLEKTAQQAPKHWQRHYSIGKMKIIQIDVNASSGRLVFRLEDFKIHPLFCALLKGYMSQTISMVTGNQNIEAAETKCMFKGDPYHEFTYNWQ